MKKINLDILRLIAAFMVVAVHTYPLLFVSDSVDYIVTRILFRIAVPFFLMITGYFTLAKKDKNALIKYTKKIALLYLASILLYLPINIYNGYFHNFNILSFLKDIFITGTMYHLWYFPATIFGLWLSYLLINKFSIKKSLIIVSILYIIGLFGDNYYGLVEKITVINIFYKAIFFIFDYTRNICLVPIFLILGYTIKEGGIKIPKKNTYAILFTITMLIEGLICMKFNLSRHSSMYFSLIPLMYLVFSFIIENSISNKNIRSLGTYIYILHPFFIVIMHFVSKIINLSILHNSLVNFICVSLLTFTASFFIDYIIKQINTHNFKKVS